MGGSFDPVHKGHIHAAVGAIKKLNLDTVVFVPNYKNPLKGKSHAPPEARLEMLRLATEGIKGLEVSGAEIKKNPPHTRWKPCVYGKNNSEKTKSCGS